MISTLYTTVYGTPLSPPSAATLQAFFVRLTALPDNMFFVLFMHYHNGKSKQEIAKLARVSELLVERWMMHGVYMLRLQHAVRTFCLDTKSTKKIKADLNPPGIPPCQRLPMCDGDS